MIDQTVERAETATQDAAPRPAHGYDGGHSRIPAAYRGRDLTQGSIPKNLWLLAWPSTITGFLSTIDHLAELVLAGFLGFRAIAGLGVAQTWVQLFNSGRMGLDTAARAMVSRAIGERNFELANHLAIQSLVLNAAVTDALMIFGIIFTDFLLRIIGVSDAVILEGALYLQLRFVSTTSFGMLNVTSNLLQAAGDAMTPMKIQGSARIFHLALMPVLVFGWLGMPQMGLAGMAVAATLAQVIGFAIICRILFSGRSLLHLSLRGFRPDWGLYGRMFRLGAPASVTMGERALAQVLLVGLVAPFGDASLAAYGLTQRLQMFVNLGHQGLGVSAGILVGQNLGARQLARAKATAWWGIGFSSLMTLAIGTLVLAFPREFLTVFSREAALLDVAVPWLQIMVIGFLAMGIGQVFVQVFNTAGDTLVSMFVTLVTIWGVQQPAALLLSGAPSLDIFGWQIPLPAISGLGEYGIAWAIAFGMLVRLAVYVPYFLWGPWWKKRVY